MEPFKLQWKDTIYLLNNAYRWNKQKVGVLLYNQMDEFALATIFDTYSASGTMETLTIAEKLSPIQTKNGLTLLPRYTLENAPPIERMLLSGTKANVLTNETISLWKNEYPSVEFSYVHAHEPDRYVLEAPLEDLAQQTDVLTAEYAAKRLEYRADTLKLEGAPYPYLAIPIPLLLGCASLVLLVYFQKRLRKNRGF
ncbi:hypothetical protein [Caldalkalibacillus mannanilyticus]|uniref:hypothetical protein n=1 Tax=Caldalkalibacillus mannanilyticus TaxID=1418 RepID=UPI0006842E3A|nr:hypothetical protein [Caldalkalibacillus mannanilyticus]